MLLEISGFQGLSFRDRVPCLTQFKQTQVSSGRDIIDHLRDHTVSVSAAADDVTSTDDLDPPDLLEQAENSPVISEQDQPSAISGDTTVPQNESPSAATESLQPNPPQRRYPIRNRVKTDFYGYKTM